MFPHMWKISEEGHLSERRCRAVTYSRLVGQHKRSGTNKPKCTIRKLVRYGIDETISYALIIANGDLEIFEEAMESSDRES